MIDSPQPVSDPAFWRNRLDVADRDQEPHKAVWYTDQSTWNAVQEAHRALLADLIRPVPGQIISVLDAGCGLGHLVRLLPTKGVEYQGVDISRDLIIRARQIHPELEGRVRVGDLRELPYDDGEFDVAICRAVEGMVTKDLGTAVWRRMERELLRVAHRLVVLGYERPAVARVVDALPEVSPVGFLRHPRGRLDYRVGQDASVEIFDLLVEEGSRRAGIGRDLVDRLRSGQYWCVYAFTRETNATARAFYARLGFVETRLPRFYRGMDGIMLTWTTRRGIVPLSPLT